MSRRSLSEELRVVIVGAGPTGLGAGYRLQELGHESWVILEASDRVGGLAASFADSAGFTYDLGGHVIFSHYDYFDQLLDRLLAGEYTELRREAWVWVEEQLVPYPFQSNFGCLSPQTVFECLHGLIQAQLAPSVPSNFREWIHATFGPGIARHFMLPYNHKVWAAPAESMDHMWIAERVSVVDIDKILRNVVLGERDTSWGPNSTFRYPLRGGTGSLCEALRRYVEAHLHLATPVETVDPLARQVWTTDGRVWPYDALLTTMPLNDLVRRLTAAPSAVREAAATLAWTGSHVVGIGLDRPAETTRNWVYFPDPHVPFHRVTYLSNYSPHMTPRPNQTLLLTETSHSRSKPEAADDIVDRVIEALVATGLVEQSDRSRLVARWCRSIDMTYPVPTVRRDQALGTIQPWLRKHGIFSRGRFGSWLYEIGNMDHSTMQGVEFADHLLLDRPETVWIARGESRPDAFDA